MLSQAVWLLQAADLGSIAADQLLRCHGARACHFLAYQRVIAQPGQPSGCRHAARCTHIRARACMCAFSHICLYVCVTVCMYVCARSCGHLPPFGTRAQGMAASAPASPRLASCPVPGKPCGRCGASAAAAVASLHTAGASKTLSLTGPDLKSVKSSKYLLKRDK
jgi:hypothetical protein